MTSFKSLVVPEAILTEYPATARISDLIIRSRQSVRDILQGKDKRLLVIVGPCSIHETQAALEYAMRLKAVTARLDDALCIVMRVYVEKPRTTIGWKGLVSDPLLDQSFDVNQGLRIARQLLLNINQLGMPAGTEFLDNFVPHYLSDLVSWCAIGARTSASPLHRELASGLSMPVGFKNSIDGNIKVAVDAVQAALHSHHYLSITPEGAPAIVSTRGNADCHIILRGSNSAPNYTLHHIEEAVVALSAVHLQPRLMVDCSHGNSMKDNQRQRIAAHALIEQVKNGSDNICGLMLESYLVAGSQALQSQTPLTYGQSITDACIDWAETVMLLDELADAVRSSRF